MIQSDHSFVCQCMTNSSLHGTQSACISAEHAFTAIIPSFFHHTRNESFINPWDTHILVQWESRLVTIEHERETVSPVRCTREHTMQQVARREKDLPKICVSESLYFGPSCYAGARSPLPKMARSSVACLSFFAEDDAADCETRRGSAKDACMHAIVYSYLLPGSTHISPECIDKEKLVS